MSVSRKTWLRYVFAAIACVFSAIPTVSLAYNPVPQGTTPTPGDGLLVPNLPGQASVLHPNSVWGKEYSHDWDRIQDAAVTLWDGSGSTTVGRRYDGNSWTPGGDPSYEANIDALANSRDTLFHDLLGDQTAMVFSHDNQIVNWDGSYATLPAGGPIPVWSGVPATPFWQIGGAGELTRSLPGAFAMDRWATLADIDSGNPPVDVDGLELWGDQPETGSALPGDADKYSLENDSVSGVSVWNENGRPYLSHSDVADAVESLLGPAPSRDSIDLDAMVLFDGFGADQDSFDLSSCNGFDCDVIVSTGVDQQGDPLASTGGIFPFVSLPDTIVFSIKQVAAFATGSELFVLNRNGVSFLQHGGVTWDSAHAQNHLSVSTAVDGMDVVGVLDINALEAIGNLSESDDGLTGDVNGDGAVNLIDLDLLGANFGRFGVGRDGGDLNGDGTVNLLDLDLLGANFGSGTGPSAAVPEPGAMILLACGAGLAMVRRR